MGSKGWRIGESARLPPMWPGFKSRRLPLSHYLFIYLFYFIFYGTHRNQSTFYLDDEERKSRGSRRLKYGSGDKDYDEDEKDGAAAFDLDGDDDDNDDDGCDDNYDDESEDEEEGSERQPKSKLSK